MEWLFQINSFKQKAWDGPLIAVKSDDVLQAAKTQVGRARLIAAAAPHAGNYLNALYTYVLCCGNSSRRHIAAHCCRPSPRHRHICSPHSCICGHPVDSSGRYAWPRVPQISRSSHMRQDSVNDLIKRALASASVPSMLES
jgi:hypothetical protein